MRLAIIIGYICYVTSRTSFSKCRATVNVLRFVWVNAVRDELPSSEIVAMKKCGATAQTKACGMWASLKVKKYPHFWPYLSDGSHIVCSSTSTFKFLSLTRFYWALAIPSEERHAQEIIWRRCTECLAMIVDLIVPCIIWLIPLEFCLRILLAAQGAVRTNYYLLPYPFKAALRAQLTEIAHAWD